MLNIRLSIVKITKCWLCINWVWQIEGCDRIGDLKKDFESIGCNSCRKCVGVLMMLAQAIMEFHTHISISSDASRTHSLSSPKNPMWKWKEQNTESLIKKAFNLTPAGFTTLSLHWGSKGSQKVDQGIFRVMGVPKQPIKEGKYTCTSTIFSNLLSSLCNLGVRQKSVSPHQSKSSPPSKPGGKWRQLKIASLASCNVGKL